MTTITFDDLFIDTPEETFLPRDFSENWEGGILENTQGDSDFVSEYAFFRPQVKESIMGIDFTKPPSLGAAIGLCITMLIGIAGIGGVFYSMTHTDVSELRAEIASARDSSGSDLSVLRSDTREDFGKVNDKLDKLTQVLSDMRVEQAKKESQPR